MTEESETIGMRLYSVMASISEVAYNAEIGAEISGDPSGEWGVTADSLWQIRAMLEGIMADLGVKTPDDIRKIQAHDRPDTNKETGEELPF